MRQIERHPIGERNSPTARTGLVAMALVAILIGGCAAGGHVERRDDFGVLVMAHGGPAQWNEAVLAAVEPLHERYDVEVAFGMADPAALQESIRKLEAHGARRIGVVRLFASGESFKERTEQILGIVAGAPPRPAQGPAGGGHDHGHEHGMELWRVSTHTSFALSEEGLLQAPEMGNVLAARAQTLSREPAAEDVLILAHGPGDDAENQRWLAQLESRADAVRSALPFRRVAVETLREDWPEKREAAQQRIRAFVQRAAAEGGTAIVIPFRVQGFGPYKKVLEGLSYTADGKGLLPHPLVTQWIDRQASLLEAGPFQSASAMR